MGVLDGDETDASAACYTNITSVMTSADEKSSSQMSTSGGARRDQSEDAASACSSWHRARDTMRTASASSNAVTRSFAVRDGIT